MTHKNTHHSVKKLFNSYGYYFYNKCYNISEEEFGSGSIHSLYASLLIYLESLKQEKNINNIVLSAAAQIIENSFEMSEEFQEGALLGFLESLSNKPNSEIYKEILPYLGIKSLKGIKDIDKFWGTDIFATHS
jgi:hypothetical protein